jgi:3-hydroxyacyl-CoA dehydrogenase
VVIEAVVENLAVKKRVLAALSPHISPRALVATNTSSLSVETLAESISVPGRFCGLHFCHPVQDRRLVEVIRTPATAPETLLRAENYVRQLGKRPLQTADVRGFAVNRLLLPYLDAAIALVRGGVDWLRIEAAAVAFGMPSGPLAQMDDIGIDVILRAAAALHRGTFAIPPQSEVLLALYQAGRLGRKSGAGFLKYTGSQPGSVDPEAVTLVAPYRTERVELSEDELAARLFEPMANAAADILHLGIVATRDDVILTLRDGLGFRGQAAQLLDWSPE